MEPILKSLQDVLDRIHQRGGPVESDYYDIGCLVTAATVILKPLSQHGDGYHAFRKALVRELFPKTVWEPGSGSLFSRIFNAETQVVGNADIMYDIYTGDHLQALPLTPEQLRWDQFILSQMAVPAVRHRPHYLRALLKSIGEWEPSVIYMLDVACGSGMALPPLAEVCGGIRRYVGIDVDADAIKRSRQLAYQLDLDAYLSQTNVLRTNILTTLGHFGLIWCAGLADYLSDRAMNLLLERLLPALAPDGIACIGNMGPHNPSRPMMDLLGWSLIYRSREELEYLAHQACAKLGWATQDRSIRIDSDPTGIQHYLRIRRISS